MDQSHWKYPQTLNSSCPLEMLSLLGISKQRLTGKYHGKIDLAKPKWLYIYLNKSTLQQIMSTGHRVRC